MDLGIPLKHSEITSFSFVFLAGSTEQSVTYLLDGRIRGKDNPGERKSEGKGIPEIWEAHRPLGGGE